MTLKSCAVKQMIRGIGLATMSTYSQTLNVHRTRLAFLKPRLYRILSPSGPLSVSGTGDAECSARELKAPKCGLIDTMKGVG